MNQPDADSPEKVVRETVREYGGRGLLRALTEAPLEDGIEFRFTWLGPLRFRIAFGTGQASGASPTLTLHGLLPSAEPDSPVARDIRKFLRTRTDDDLPAHRRIDPKLASVRLVPARASDPDDIEPSVPGMALELEILDGAFEYGVRKLLNLVNEVWVRLNDRHQRYMWEAFNAPME